MNGVGEFLRDAWAIARPYFGSSEERWSARGLLALVIALNLSLVGLSVLLNFWRADFYNALQAKDWDGFIHLLLLYRSTDKGFTFGFTPLALTHVTVAVFDFYLRQWLQIRWRNWMTDRFLSEWMTGRASYRISLTGTHETGTDNPDQRITEDVRDFTDKALLLGLGLISRLVSLFSFLTILWGLSGTLDIFGVSIPGDLFWIALIYAIAGTVATHLVGGPLAALNFRRQRVEADFRYGLVRIRENVEAIALLDGERKETASSLVRFREVVSNFRAIMHRTLLLNLVTEGYGQTAVIVPVVAAAPAYFAGKITLGAMFQTVDAFGRVQSALSWIVDRYEDIALWRSIVERLATFQRAIDAARAMAAGVSRVDSPDGSVRLEGLELGLPNGTTLLADASVVLRPDNSVVITGPSGSGKSTLFRAISGIWPFARGTIVAPGSMFFLPQRPYIPLGSLAEVIAYPHDAATYDPAALADALRDVGLGALTGRLDQEDNWPQSLSGGEQQRISAARALLAQPRWIFLDEATSNLDTASEAALYQALRTRLPDATLVSIAHRPSVAAFHDSHLVIRRDEGEPGTLAAAVTA